MSNLDMKRSKTNLLPVQLIYLLYANSKRKFYSLGYFFAIDKKTFALSLRALEYRKTKNTSLLHDSP